MFDSLFSSLFKKNKSDFPDLVWSKQDILDWKKLTTDPEKRDLLRLWYIEVYTTTIFPEGVNNQLLEAEIPAEIDRILLTFHPPKIRNKKRIVTIAIVLIIIAAIGIYYATTLA